VVPIDVDKLSVVHNEPAGRFEIEAGRWMAVLEYEMRGNKMIFTHTGVPRPLEAQGIGSRLARAGLEYAREKAHRVVPACEFMEIYIKRHPEYMDLVSQ
jgi:predicted GNAT family acetyltransferase